MEADVKRVVITGLGVISSIGIGKDTFWDALKKGQSGISTIECFDTSSYPTHLGGEVKNFHAEEFVDTKKIPALSRAACFALAAAKLSLSDAAINLADFDPAKTGVILGTTMGETQIVQKLNESFVKGGVASVDEKLVPLCPANIIGAQVARELQLRGVNFVIPTACAAGNYAIGYACDLLKNGEAQMILAGGVDAFSRIAFTGFNRLFAVAPEKCQPFDKNRKGMILGEGAGVLLLEELKTAQKRKAPIYAEIIGYGLSCDAHHITSPHRRGIKKAMAKALECAKIQAKDIDYISAHGTGTIQNDKEEAGAIKEMFVNKPPASSIKSILGHCMGAASAIEAISCCLTIKESILPPTINFETPDPECDIDCVPNEARKARVGIALNNSFAFGGNNCCVVFKKQSDNHNNP